MGSLSDGKRERAKEGDRIRGKASCQARVLVLSARGFERAYWHANAVCEVGSLYSHTGHHVLCQRGQQQIHAKRAHTHTLFSIYSMSNKLALCIR